MTDRQERQEADKALREALVKILDDYLATHGCQAIRDWLAATETHGRPFHYDCNVRDCTLDGHKR